MTEGGPELSPDGRFYRDGDRWVPVPAPVRAYPWTAGVWGCVGALVVIVVVVVLVVLNSH